MAIESIFNFSLLSVAYSVLRELFEDILSLQQKKKKEEKENLATEEIKKF